jgi:hypothetical protein
MSSFTICNSALYALRNNGGSESLYLRGEEEGEAGIYARHHRSQIHVDVSNVRWEPYVSHRPVNGSRCAHEPRIHCLSNKPPHRVPSARVYPVHKITEPLFDEINCCAVVEVWVVFVKHAVISDHRKKANTACKIRINRNVRL